MMKTLGEKIINMLKKSPTDISESDEPLFSSDTDDDPTYYPSDSDDDCHRNLMNMSNLHLSSNSDSEGDLDLPPSSSVASPILEVIPKIIVHDVTILKPFIGAEPNDDVGVDTSPLRNRNLKTPSVYAQTSNKENFITSALGSRIVKTSDRNKRKQIREKDFCFYCESEVLNFARHIKRNHSQEFEVQKIFQLTPNSKERKRLIASLRKKGNFLQNSSRLYKPVHKTFLNKEENYLPCPFCHGLYSRRMLWRHKRICPENTSGKRLTPGDGQNIFLSKSSIGVDLRERVFSRMQADKVSLCAKKDPLICAFGTRFLSTHREKHHALICSRKMRELGKMLMESQKMDVKIKSLYELIHPQYFDIVVQSAKILAKYDSNTDTYESPTFAMNISRSLKDCCDIAILHICKRKYKANDLSTAEVEADVTMFKRLLETTWRHEISSQAGHDLNTKTWNKITIIPLAADLKLFRTYLMKKGNEAVINLKQNMKNLQNFVLLMETIFCRHLLLNRKRVGELQRMKLGTYLRSDEKNEHSCEEFSEAITAYEKILLKSFKRVVIRGKRGRGVPVLFSKDIQEHMNLFLEARSNFIENSNLFLFGIPKSNNPITGYKVIQKHAKLCGAKHPEALTSTKLRKHLATLTQVFDMTNNEIEQLATFMGHTIDVHSKVYRLPDDVYQTAKIAKLLMLMERGDAGKYKGKSLEDIDIDMDEEIGLQEDMSASNCLDGSDAEVDLSHEIANSEAFHDYCLNHYHHQNMYRSGCSFRGPHSKNKSFQIISKIISKIIDHPRGTSVRSC